MTFLGRVTGHHEDEQKAVGDALPAQKIRVSVERRVHGLDQLVVEEVPEEDDRGEPDEHLVDLTHKKHVALAKIREARLALEDMLNAMDLVEVEHEE